MSQRSKSYLETTKDNEPIFMDANIPMYAAGRPSQFKAACVEILNKIERGELRAVIDTEVIQEILYRYHNIRLDAQAIQLSRQILRLGARILPVTRSDVEMAISLYEKYSRRRIPPRDGLHVAVMLGNNLTQILTVDKHFDVIEEVQRIDPIRML